MGRSERCTFFGHRDFARIDCKESIKAVFEHLIISKNVCEFFSGSMGNFDRICEGVVRELKIKYPFIRLKWVIPYLNYNRLQEAKKYLKLYDEAIIPWLGDENGNLAVTKRNMYMVDNSKFVVYGIYKEGGGANFAVEYAKKQAETKVIDIFKVKI